MNAVFAFDPSTNKYSMQWENKVYYFTYDKKTASVMAAWDASGKLISRSYKGFRNKLGIKPGSSTASEFVNIFQFCRNA
jgi:hypothetical protein